MILGPSGRVKAGLKSTGPVLGVAGDAVFGRAAPVALEPGDIVLLVTAGTMAATAADGAAFDLPAFVHQCRADRAQDIADKLCRAAREAFRGATAAEDVTAVVVKVGVPA
jgi:serine phosphatase RsbU (regulator of sigma subunit)